MAQTRKNIIILSALYIISRLLFLTRFPIFNDESIYLHEAWVMTRIPGQIWYSLSDTGKQPLLFWLYGFVWQIIGDPLFAGRLVSVLVGITTVWGVYLLGGWVAAILIITAPMFLFFDRLALVDSALAALFSWILVLLVKLGKQNALRTATIIGILVGISFWLKSIGFLFTLVVSLLLAYLLFDKKKPLAIVFPLLVFIAIATWIALPLFLRPEAARIFETAHLYTYSLQELMAKQFVTVADNIVQAFLDYAGYISPIVVAAFFMSLRSMRATKTRILFFAWLTTFCVIVFFGKGAHARYVLFTAVPLVVLSSFVLVKHKLLLGVTVACMTALSVLLIVDPPAFFHLFPLKHLQGEAYGYVDGWPSGYGAKEALATIDADRKGEHATVAVRWDSGNPEDAMFVYTAGQSAYSFKYFDPRLQKDTYEVLTAARTGKAYFVTRQGQYNGMERFLVPLGKFYKPGAKESVEVFRIQII